MRPRRSGKRLLYIAVLQEFCECGRGVLFSAVTVKSETAGIAAFPKSGPEGAGDQVRACVAGYPIADDLAGEKIQDDTKVDPVVVDFKICDVTDPDLVGAVCGELLIQQVLLFILLMLLYCFLASGRMLCRSSSCMIAAMRLVLTRTPLSARVMRIFSAPNR